MSSPQTGFDLPLGIGGATVSSMGCPRTISLASTSSRSCPLITKSGTVEPRVPSPLSSWAVDRVTPRSLCWPGVVVDVVEWRMPSHLCPVFVVATTVLPIKLTTTKRVLSFMSTAEAPSTTATGSD